MSNMFNIGDKVKHTRHAKWGVGDIRAVYPGYPGVSNNKYDVRFPFPCGYEYEIPENNLEKVDD